MACDRHGQPKRTKRRKNGAHRASGRPTVLVEPGKSDASASPAATRRQYLPRGRGRYRRPLPQFHEGHRNATSNGQPKNKIRLCILGRKGLCAAHRLEINLQRLTMIWNRQGRQRGEPRGGQRLCPPVTVFEFQRPCLLLDILRPLKREPREILVIVRRMVNVPAPPYTFDDGGNALMAVISGVVPCQVDIQRARFRDQSQRTKISFGFYTNLNAACPPDGRFGLEDQ